MTNLAYTAADLEEMSRSDMISNLKLLRGDGRNICALNAKSDLMRTTLLSMLGGMAEDAIPRSDPRSGPGADGVRRVHGSNGAWVAGSWVDIEDCPKHFNISGGSGEACTGCGVPCPRSRTRHSAAKPDGSYDVVVVGAGCIGSAVARELAKTNLSVLVLEAADDVTQGATKGNSGIVHAGFDDTPGSVRSKYCWPGNQMFPALDRELHFGLQLNGSLVVAKGPADEKHLQVAAPRRAAPRPAPPRPAPCRSWHSTVNASVVPVRPRVRE
jgi:hypothetical protein